MEEADGDHTKNNPTHDYTVQPDECGRCKQDAQDNYNRLRNLDAEYAEVWRRQHARWIER